MLCPTKAATKSICDLASCGIFRFGGFCGLKSAAKYICRPKKMHRTVCGSAPYYQVKLKLEEGVLRPLNISIFVFAYTILLSLRKKCCRNYFVRKNICLPIYSSMPCDLRLTKKSLQKDAFYVQFI